MEDYLLQAVDDIVSILKSPSNALLPTLQEGDVTRNAILDIATALKTALPPPKPPQIKMPESRVVTHKNQSVPESRVIDSPNSTVE